MRYGILDEEKENAGPDWEACAQCGRNSLAGVHAEPARIPMPVKQAVQTRLDPRPKTAPERRPEEQSVRPIEETRPPSAGARDPPIVESERILRRFSLPERHPRKKLPFGGNYDHLVESGETCLQTQNQSRDQARFGEGAGSAFGEENRPCESVMLEIRAHQGGERRTARLIRDIAGEDDDRFENPPLPLDLDQCGVQANERRCAEFIRTTEVTRLHDERTVSVLLISHVRPPSREEQYHGSTGNRNMRLTPDKHLHSREHLLADDLSRMLLEPKRFAAYLGIAKMYYESDLRTLARRVVEKEGLDPKNRGRYFFGALRRLERKPNGRPKAPARPKRTPQRTANAKTTRYPRTASGAPRRRRGGAAHGDTVA